jgi:folate receptor
MSDACQRFFVQESCLYECEPSAGLFRKYPNNSDPEKLWQMFQMPIKKSYCDAWYDACLNDYFCGQGSFFECEAFYWETIKMEETKASNENQALIVGFSIAAVMAIIGIVFTAVLIGSERKGAPLFAPPEQKPEGVST